MLTVEQMKALQVGDVVYVAWLDSIAYDAVDELGDKRSVESGVVIKCCKKTRHVRLDSGIRTIYALDDGPYLYTRAEVDEMRTRAVAIKADIAAKMAAKRARARLIEGAVETICGALTHAGVTASPFYNVNREPSLQITVPPMHAERVAAAIIAALKSEGG